MAANRTLVGTTVVLDPGHGGSDSGAIRAGLREDVVNYRMASTVMSLLRSRGATVVLTVTSAALLTNLKEGFAEPPFLRTPDARLVFTNVPVRLRPDSSPDDLYRRAAVAAQVWRGLPEMQRNTGRGIYFLSLHCDELRRSPGRGARVYFDKREKTPSRFALLLKQRLTFAGLTNSGRGAPIPRHYGVLNPVYNPIPERALLEMATLSSPTDRNAVRSPKWRWSLAHIIVGTIETCERR